MAIQDIEGARPRYLIKQEKHNSYYPNSGVRDDSRMQVQDINTMDNKKKNLYKREVDPLNPTYMLPEVSMHQARLIGPIDNQQKNRRLSRRQTTYDNNTLDILGAQPKHHGSVMKLESQEGRSSYYNRNKGHNGDIITNSNENPMQENGQFATHQKKQFETPSTRRLIRDQASPLEQQIVGLEKVNLTYDDATNIDHDSAAGKRNQLEKFKLGVTPPNEQELMSQQRAKRQSHSMFQTENKRGAVSYD